MPAEGWNRKFMGVGNGGWSGAISYPALATALGRGYAVASTNTGHDGGDASFVPGHPEKLVISPIGAVHEMTVKAKALTEAYYGNAPARAYWNGCSSGGKQGLKEVQKFPRRLRRHHRRRARELLDTSRWQVILWPACCHAEGPRRLSPTGQTRVLHKASLAACDKLDGVEDGLLENPGPVPLRSGRPVQGVAQDDCLTAPKWNPRERSTPGARIPEPASRSFQAWRPAATRVDRARRTRALRHPGLPLPTRGLQQARLGLPHARLRQRRRSGGQARQRPDRRPPTPI